MSAAHKYFVLLVSLTRRDLYLCLARLLEGVLVEIGILHAVLVDLSQNCQSILDHGHGIIRVRRIAQ